MNLFGHWIGTFEGTRFGAVTIGLEQTGDQLQGIATLNEPSLGYYQYLVQGSTSPSINLHLRPAPGTRDIGLGVVEVNCVAVDDDTINGPWKSTNRYFGVFHAKRYAGGGGRTSGAQRLNVFISYSHSDRTYLDALLVHLRPLERAGQVDIWADTKIEAGARWKEEIAAALDKACVAVLLISPEFLASDFIVENELPPILEKAQANGMKVLPLILRPCRFTRDSTLSGFQAINDPSDHLSKLPTWRHDEYYDRIVREVEAAIPRINQQATSGNDRRTPISQS